MIIDLLFSIDASLSNVDKKGPDKNPRQVAPLQVAAGTKAHHNHKRKTSQVSSFLHGFGKDRSGSVVGYRW